MRIDDKKNKNTEECSKDNNILRYFYKTAKEKLINGDIEGAHYYFYKAESILGCAYCGFIEGNIDECIVMLNLIKDSSPMVNWLLCLIGIIKGDKNKAPTYFQIRNFFEFDLSMLFLYKNYKFAKKILENLEYFSKYNGEIYKLSARVFMDNQMEKNAINCLKKSIDIYYNDPEVHFMLGEVYLRIGDKISAKEEYKKSNEVTGRYFPAEKKLREMDKN